MKKGKKIIVPMLASLLLNSVAFQYPVNAETSDTEEKFDISTLGLRGDVNGDGVMNANDLTIFRQYLLGIDTSLEVKYETDLNCDGKISISDLVLMKSGMLNDTILWNSSNMPKMDGSTSAIPLEAGFKAKMLGIDYSDAKSSVNHHKTHESFKMLLSGENDLIFTVPISEDQQKEADEAGVKLNFAPVAKEGFVFVVNKDNPVDSLTQQQIKDIYSGKITNWKELGGKDEKIIPYQRNTDSGSQNYMTEFMSDSELMEAPKEYTIGAMGALMDAVAVYDNAEGAIGYSVYSYAAQMYENSDDVKFISVDGVKPSRITMNDRTYPLISDSYILYTDSASQDTLNFVEWALSEEGQLCVLENGYVPVRESEYPDRLKLYTSKGTGDSKPEDYQPDKKSSTIRKSYYYTDIKDSGAVVDFLIDKEFEKQINSDIKNVLDSMDDKADVLIRGKNGYITVYILTESDNGSHDYNTTLWCKSGGYCFDQYYGAVTLNYDLKNNKKIEKLSDYFYKDADFVSMINNKLSSQIEKLSSKDLKTDFLGITGKQECFSFDSLIFEENNPYIPDNVEINFDSYFLPDVMVTGQYFDMANVIDDEKAGVSYLYERNEWNCETVLNEDGEYALKVNGSAFHTDEEAEAYQKVLDRALENAIDLRSKSGWCTDKTRIILTPAGYRANTLRVIYVNFGKVDGAYGPNMLDPDTGEIIHFSDIFGKEFEYVDDSLEYIKEIDLTTGYVEYYSRSGGDYIKLKLNMDHVNTKYIYKDEMTKAERKELKTPRKGEIAHCMWRYEKNDAPNMDSSYVLDYGPKKVPWPVEEEWHITAKYKTYSHGETWYECWDSDDGDYYGWFRSYDLDFYD